MAARQQRRPLDDIVVQRLERQLRLKVAMILGYDVLKPLEENWIMSFIEERTVTLPLFHCKTCSFAYMLQVHLEGGLWHGKTELPSMVPLYQHQQLCKAFHLPMVQSAVVNDQTFNQLTGSSRQDRLDSIARSSRYYEVECVKETIPLRRVTSEEWDNNIGVPHTPYASRHALDTASDTSQEEWCRAQPLLKTVAVNIDGVVLPDKCLTEAEPRKQGVIVEVHSANPAQFVMSSSDGDDSGLEQIDEGMQDGNDPDQLLDDIMEVLQPMSVQSAENKGPVTDMALGAAMGTDQDDDYLQIEQVVIGDNSIIRQGKMINRQAVMDGGYERLIQAVPQEADDLMAMLKALGSDSTESSDSTDDTVFWESADGQSTVMTAPKLTAVSTVTLAGNEKRRTDTSAEDEQVMSGESSVLMKKMVRRAILVPRSKFSANQRSSPSKRGKADVGKIGKACEVIIRALQKNLNRRKDERDVYGHKRRD